MVDTNYTLYSNINFLQDMVISFADAGNEESLKKDKVILLITSNVLAGISIFSLFLVHFAFWFFKSIRTFAFELVAWMCFSSILFNFSVFFHMDENDQLSENIKSRNFSATCKVQTFLNILFDLSTMMWGTIISFTAYISVANEEHLEKHKMKYRIGFILISYLLPLTFTLIVFLTNSYGPSGYICWILVEDKENVAEMILTIIYQVWTWLMILLNCLFVYKVLSLLKDELKNEQVLMDRYSSKLKLYPIIQIISFLPACVNRIYNLSTNDSLFVLSLIQCIFDNATGLMFACVFGYNPTVRKSIVECFSTLFCKRLKIMKTSEQLEESVNKKIQARSLTDIDDSITE